ncbi:MAG: hypothetical protein IJX25_05310 [Clostridia bacterium]|nr:hypothetical protein [Clostridia bacterium]MBQ8792415.1 hypothetical protein [Clostridia bacterium]
MENRRPSAPVREWGRYMKSKLAFARLAGLFFCLVCAGSLALLYFKIFDQWMCIIMVSFSMACIFIANSFLQSVKTGRTWQVVNLILSAICYVAVITFVTIGFIEGSISFGF